MSEHNDIYRIIESLDAAQRSVKQLPALFKPANTSPQIGGKYPGLNATRGYLVGEGEEEIKPGHEFQVPGYEQRIEQVMDELGVDHSDAEGIVDAEVRSGKHRQWKHINEADNENPMIQAVHHRIAFTRPEWIVKYGVDAIEYAIEEIVGDDWDGEEIGSSDVSGYIRMIGDYLRDHAGSREEMDDRKPFAEDKDEEDSEHNDDEQDDESGFVGSRDWESEDDEWDPSKSEYRFQQSRRRQKKGYVPEGSAEKYSYRVTFDDGTHSNVAIPLSKIFQGDNSAKDLITQHFARKGRTVKEIEMMFPPKQGVSEGSGSVPWQAVINALAAGYPDADPTDSLAPIMRKYGVEFDELDRLAQQNGYRDIYAVLDEFDQDQGVSEGVETVSEKDWPWLSNLYSPEAADIGKRFVTHYNITDINDVQMAVELIQSFIDEAKYTGQPLDLNRMKSEIAKGFRMVYRGIGQSPSFRKKFKEQTISEATATEDVLSSIKKKLGDYLQDVATAIKTDPDLKDKIPQSIDKISAVKTIRTDDGHEIKIHGNEDDGFRVTIRNRDLNTKFKDLDEATMACEMYCARRRQQRENADYIEEKR